MNIDEILEKIVEELEKRIDYEKKTDPIEEVGRLGHTLGVKEAIAIVYKNFKY